MPITPKYDWSQTQATLEVRVEVPGASRTKADVFATDAFLKINCPPYLFALDLHGDVDDSRSTATVTADGVTFKLHKKQDGIWDALEAKRDKAELTKRRNESIDRAYRNLEEASRTRRARKQQEDKDATTRSMEMDRKKRAEIERRKAEELSAERSALQQWQSGLQKDGSAAAVEGDESDYEDDLRDDAIATAAAGQQGAGDAASDATAMPDHPDYHGRGWQRSNVAGDGTAAASASGRDKPLGVAAAGAAGKAAASAAGHDSDSEHSESERPAGARGSDEEDGGGGQAAGGHGAIAPRLPQPAAFKPLPPPRAKLQPVAVNFTQLETPHLPARQQREEEIRQIRKKATDQRLVGDAVDMSERQPMFLKDKGDAMYKQGNYRGAVNAYSRAIELDDSLAPVRANRAACYLQLGDHEAAAADCSAALEMLAVARERLESGALAADEALPLRRQVVKLHVRRAQALTQMGSLRLHEALDEYEAAMRLDPQDAQLAAGREELLSCMQPADAAMLRQRGDARFRSKDYEGALEAFTLLVGMPRSHVPASERLAAYSNRAACHLVLERYPQAVADCDAGLALLLDAGHEYGAAAGEQGAARLTAWADGLSLQQQQQEEEEDACRGGQGSSSGDMAPAAAAGAAARLLARRGAAHAHLQHFPAAARDHGLAARLLRRLGEEGRAVAAEQDTARMQQLEEAAQRGQVVEAAAVAAPSKGAAAPGCPSDQPGACASGAACMDRSAGVDGAARSCVEGCVQLEGRGVAEISVVADHAASLADEAVHSGLLEEVDD